MTIRIWNPTKFKIPESGKPGRSNCPSYRTQTSRGKDPGDGSITQYYTFQPDEVKEVEDRCGEWLISEWGFYGLVEKPDRNKYPKEEDYDTAEAAQKQIGIKAVFKYASDKIQNYRKQAGIFRQEGHNPPLPSDYVVQAMDIVETYKEEILYSDPATIRKREVMNKLLGQERDTKADDLEAMRQAEFDELRDTGPAKKPEDNGEDDADSFERSQSGRETFTQ